MGIGVELLPAVAKLPIVLPGATAFSCGVKTMVRLAFRPILATNHSRICTKVEFTNLIATSSPLLTLRQPFYAHVPFRKREFIAEQLLSSPVDFAAGGGQPFFFDRLDERNLCRHAGVSTQTLDTETWDPISVTLTDQNGMPLLRMVGRISY